MRKAKDLQAPLQADCLAFLAGNQAAVSEQLARAMAAEGISKQEYAKAAGELNRMLGSFGGQLESSKPIRLVNTELAVPDAIRPRDSSKAVEDSSEPRKAARGYWQKIAHQIDHYVSREVPQQTSVDVVGRLADAKSQRFALHRPRRFPKKSDLAEYMRSHLSHAVEAHSRAKLKRRRFPSFHISSLEHMRSASSLQTPTLHSASDIFASQREVPAGLQTAGACPRSPCLPDSFNRGPVRPLASNRPHHEAKLRSTLASTAWQPANKSARADAKARLLSSSDRAGVYCD